MKAKKSKLQELREDIIAGIRNLLVGHMYDSMDITVCSSTPIIYPSADDQDFNTYTLDRVCINVDKDIVLIDSSSSNDSRTDRAEELGTDTLIEILEFLEDNEELIWEKNEEADEDFIMDTYHKEDVCMGDLLAGMKVSELPHGTELTVEQVFELYMRCKNKADGDEFFLENDSCMENEKQRNLLSE